MTVPGHRQDAALTRPARAIFLCLASLLFVSPATAQEDPPAPASALTLSGSIVYNDQYSTKCDAAHAADNAANNPFAGVNPLVCHNQSFGQDSSGNCSLKGVTLIKKVGTTCYYCAPVEPPLIDGMIIPIDDTQQAGIQGFNCGVDSQDPNCLVVCSRQTGSGPYIPAPGTVLAGNTGTQQQVPVSIPVANTPVTPTLQATAVINPCEPNIDQSTPAKQAAAAPLIAQYAAECNAERCQHNPDLDVCKTLPAQASTSTQKPPQTQTTRTTTPPPTLVTNTVDYIRGVIDGFGGCIGSYADVIAGAAAFAQGDFVNAARFWGITPGQSSTLKLIYAELTTPVVGQNVSAYDQGVVAGQRICSYGVVPVVQSAAEAAVAKAVSKALPTKKTPPPPPKSEPTPTGSTPPTPIEPAKPPVKPTPTAPTETAGNPPVETPSPAPAEPPAATPTGPTDSTPTPRAANPLPDTTVANDATNNPTKLAGQVIDTAQGPTQLGEFLGGGTFGDVYQLPEGKVIKISNELPGSNDSIPRQATGAARLMEAGIDTPRIYDVEEGSPTVPGKIVMDDTNAKWPGSKQISSKQFKAMTPAEQVPYKAAITTLTDKLAKAGYIWPDNHFGNMTFIPDGKGGWIAGIHDADLILTPTEMMNELIADETAIEQNTLAGSQVNPGSPAAQALKEALASIGMTEEIGGTIDPQSMMDLLETSRVGGTLPNGTVVPVP